MVVGMSIFSWHGFTILYNDAMFVRVKRSVPNGSTYEYLQIVESFRDSGRPRQRVIATLGRREKVIASGVLDGLLRSLGKFSKKLRVAHYHSVSGGDSGGSGGGVF